jgi:hypothetical protein
MATEEELNRQQELNRLLREEATLRGESFDISSSLVDSLKETLGINSRRTTFASNLLGINKNINKAILDQKSGLIGINELSKQISKNNFLIEKSQLTQESLGKSLGETRKKEADEFVKQVNLVNSLNKKIDEELAKAEKGEQINKRRLVGLKGRLSQAEAAVENEGKSLNNIQQQYAFNVLNTKELEKQTQKRKEELKLEEQIQENLGVAGDITKALGQIPGIGSFAASALSEVTDEARKITEETGKVPGKFSLMNNLVSKVGKNIVTKMLDPFTLIGSAVAFLVKTIKEVDKSTEETARNLNISYQEANNFRQELSQASIINGNLFITSKGLLETNLAINSALGTNVKLNDKNVALFTELRTVAGLTNEELLGVYKLTIGTNKELEDITGEILMQAKVSSNRLGVSLNEKEILKSIKDVSAATTLSLGKNPGLIADAVATAKSLGMELNKVDQIAGSLLQFESSIEAELEAELLLGKNINLEKARSAALNNDLATVAKEIAKEAGTAAEFGEMNRIQQEAIAKSVGMDRDELAKTLFIQEQLLGLTGEKAKEEERNLNTLIAQKGIGEAQRILEKEGVENLRNQAGIATQFNQVVDKLKENFTLIATALMPVFNMIAGMVGALSEMPVVLGAILGILVAMKAVSAFLAIKSIVQAVAGIFAGNAKFGPAGLVASIAGVGALVGGVATAVSATDVGDFMETSKGKTTISTKEGGLFNLSDNDDIIAAPGLASKGMSGGNNSALITEIRALRTALESRPINVNTTIELDGEKIGSNKNVIRGLGNRSTELGNEVSKNSYQIQ